MKGGEKRKSLIEVKFSHCWTQTFSDERFPPLYLCLFFCPSLILRLLFSPFRKINLLSVLIELFVLLPLIVKHCTFVPLLQQGVEPTWQSVLFCLMTWLKMYLNCWFYSGFSRLVCTSLYQWSIFLLSLLFAHFLIHFVFWKWIVGKRR